MAAECPFCHQIPEMYFGQWVPHRPGKGECPYETELPLLGLI